MSDQYDGASLQLVPGTLRGYRAWYVPREFGLLGHDYPTALAPLKSLSMNFYWYPGSSDRATCFGQGFLENLSYGQHPTPVEGCGCGYYATYRLQDLPAFQAWRSLASADQGYIVGSVSAYGKIALGTRGFRAEYMKIESLVLPPSVDWLAKVYQASHVVSFGGLVNRFPPSNVDELLESAESERL